MLANKTYSDMLSSSYSQLHVYNLSQLNKEIFKSPSISNKKYRKLKKHKHLKKLWNSNSKRFKSFINFRQDTNMNNYLPNDIESQSLSSVHQLLQQSDSLCDRKDKQLPMRHLNINLRASECDGISDSTWKQDENLRHLHFPFNWKLNPQQILIQSTTTTQGLNLKLDQYQIAGIANNSKICFYPRESQKSIISNQHFPIKGRIERLKESNTNLDQPGVAILAMRRNKSLSNISRSKIRESVNYQIQLSNKNEFKIDHLLSDDLSEEFRDNNLKKKIENESSLNVACWEEKLRKMNGSSKKNVNKLKNKFSKNFTSTNLDINTKLDVNTSANTRQVHRSFQNHDNYYSNIESVKNLIIENRPKTSTTNRHSNRFRINKYYYDDELSRTKFHVTTSPHDNDTDGIIIACNTSKDQQNNINSNFDRDITNYPTITSSMYGHIIHTNKNYHIGPNQPTHHPIFRTRRSISVGNDLKTMKSNDSDLKSHGAFHPSACSSNKEYNVKNHQMALLDHSRSTIESKPSHELKWSDKKCLSYSDIPFVCSAAIYNNERDNKFGLGDANASNTDKDMTLCESLRRQLTPNGIENIPINDSSSISKPIFNKSNLKDPFDDLNKTNMNQIGVGTLKDPKELLYPFGTSEKYNYTRQNMYLANSIKSKTKNENANSFDDMLNKKSHLNDTAGSYRNSYRAINLLQNPYHKNTQSVESIRMPSDPNKVHIIGDVLFWSEDED